MKRWKRIYMTKIKYIILFVLFVIVFSSPLEAETDMNFSKVHQEILSNGATVLCRYIPESGKNKKY